MKLLLPVKDRFQMSETEPIKIQAVNSFHKGSRKDAWQEGRICCLLGCKYYFLHLFQSCSSTLYKTQCWMKALFVYARWESWWGFPYTSKSRGKVQQDLREQLSSEGSSRDINKNKTQTDHSLNGSSWALTDVFPCEKGETKPHFGLYNHLV